MTGGSTPASTPPTVKPSASSYSNQDLSIRQRSSSRVSSVAKTSDSRGLVLAATPPRAPLPTKPPPVTAAAPKRTTTAAQRPLSQPPGPLADKMSMTAIVAASPATEPPKMSMTSKEWVIPPRPKPGRKPATDTPPTKRKAQNRAAQRAFRERRAARVGELEELLDQQREEYENRETDLKNEVHNLELDLNSFRSRCNLLENMLEKERQERVRAETEVEALKQGHHSNALRKQSIHNLQHRSRDHRDSTQHRNSTGSTHQAPSRSSKDFSIAQIITPPDSMDASSSFENTEHITCGDCSPTSRCACAEQVLASSAAGCGKCAFGTQCECLEQISRTESKSHDLKRPSSPSTIIPTDKRQKPNSLRAIDDETDFTAFFSEKSSNAGPLPAPQLPPSAMLVQIPSVDTLNLKDGCGFCKDGTYCVCADTAMATPAMTPPETSTFSDPRQADTPPPSEADTGPSHLIMEMTADGAVKLPPRAASSKKPITRGCGTSGPGTCAQCQADPKSGLFCRLMAANVGREGGGCCGGKGAGGGCCKTSSKTADKITLPSLPSLGLTCAEAYQTLASHRNFDKASDDISSWLPKLKATPRPGDTKTVPHGRMPIEVEAASIMSVLKEFDIRFGREC